MYTTDVVSSAVTEIVYLKGISYTMMKEKKMTTRYRRLLGTVRYDTVWYGHRRAMVRSFDRSVSYGDCHSI